MTYALHKLATYTNYRMDDQQLIPKNHCTGQQSIYVSCTGIAIA